jgi:hypothetical protein
LTAAPRSVGPLARLHVAQQRVHFRHGELAVGAHRAVAGHGGQQFVAPPLDHLAGRRLAQFLQQGAQQCAGISAGQQRRHGAHRQFGRPGLADVETEPFEHVGVLEGGGHLALAHRQHGRDQQPLHRRFALEQFFQLFVKDAFVCRMHVYQHQTCAVLRQHVDAVQLGQREAERRAADILIRRLHRLPDR